VVDLQSRRRFVRGLYRIRSGELLARERTLAKAYAIEYAEGVRDDFKVLPARARREIADAIDEQLHHVPTRATRNRKPLPGFRPPWEHRPPLWELRVRQYRVYYDVDKEAALVTIRAVRRKPPHRTTEEIV